MTLAFVFPGQGSQSVGMLSALAEVCPEVRKTFAEGSEALGYDLWNLVQNGPESELNQTGKTQPAMLAAGVAVWRVWLARQGKIPAVMAGHSLGEYTALVCAGALDFADAVRLVAERGRYMQEAVPAGAGAMAAILGLEDAQVVQVCAEAAQGEVVAAVNFNSPGQVVVAGTATAVARAVELSKQAGAKRSLILPVSVPSHCVLMKPAAERLAALLRTIPMNIPRIPVVNNVDVAIYGEVEKIRDALIRQLYNPVRWVETIRTMNGAGVKILVECGPGKVLTGLNKRINKDMAALSAFDTVKLDEALRAV